MRGVICVNYDLSSLDSRGEVFIEALLSLGCRVNGWLCPNSMTKEVVKGRLRLPRIMEEMVLPLTELVGILT